MQKVELSGEMTSKPTRTQHFARNEAMDDAFSIRAIRGALLPWPILT